MNDIVMTITLSQSNGQVSVTGPIDNKLVSFGLLELARESITEFHRTKQGKIVPIHGSLNGGTPA